jgi:hypothetical protein
MSRAMLFRTWLQIILKPEVRSQIILDKALAYKSASVEEPYYFKPGF